MTAREFYDTLRRTMAHHQQADPHYLDTWQAQPVLFLNYEGFWPCCNVGLSGGMLCLYGRRGVRDAIRIADFVYQVSALEPQLDPEVPVVYWSHGEWHTVETVKMVHTHQDTEWQLWIQSPEHEPSITLEPPR